MVIGSLRMPMLHFSWRGFSAELWPSAEDFPKIARQPLRRSSGAFSDMLKDVWSRPGEAKGRKKRYRPGTTGDTA